MFELRTIRSADGADQEAPAAVLIWTVRSVFLPSLVKPLRDRGPELRGVELSTPRPMRPVAHAVMACGLLDEAALDTDVNRELDVPRSLLRDTVQGLSDPSVLLALEVLETDSGDNLAYGVGAISTDVPLVDIEVDGVSEVVTHLRGLPIILLRSMARRIFLTVDHRGSMVRFSIP